MQLVELQGISGALAEGGVALFAISYDSVETLEAFAGNHGITFPLLADEGSHAIRALGMVDDHLDAHHAEFGGIVRDDQRGVCYPGVFVLDEAGFVTQRRFQRNYRLRESGTGLIEQALGIASPALLPTAEAAHDRVRIRVHLDSPSYWRYQLVHVVIEFTIAPGWHVYAAPTPDGYVPLTVRVSGVGVEAGEPAWPKATPFHVAGLDESFLTYSGFVRLAVPFAIIVQRGEPLGERTVHVELSYQACDAASCDLPRTLGFDLTLQERPAVD